MNTDGKGYEEDRRKHTRKEVVTNIQYRVVWPTCGQAKSRNISERGLCFVLDQELPIGALLEMKFELPGESSNPIEILAKVLWQKPIEGGYLTGIKFGT